MGWSVVPPTNSDHDFRFPLERIRESRRVDTDAFTHPHLSHTRVFSLLSAFSTSSQMARATRASAQQEKDNPPEPAPQFRKAAASKKRKRTSFPDGDDQPANKHLRTDDDIKEEDDSPEPDDGPISTSSSSSLQLPSSGDVPIQSEYAEKILEILEVYVHPCCSSLHVYLTPC